MNREGRVPEADMEGEQGRSALRRFLRFRALCGARRPSRSHRT